MTSDPTHLQHALPSVLADAQALAAAGRVDTSGLTVGPMLFDLSDLDRLLITGRDRQRFLHAMLSNDVSGLEAGQGRWATFNSVKGRIVSDVRLLQVDSDRKSGSLIALLEPGAGESFISGLDPFIIAEKVHFEPQPDVATWLLAGAGVDSVLKNVGATVPPPELFAHVETSIAGCATRVIRFDRTGSDEGNLLLWMAAADCEPVLNELGDLHRGSRVLLDASRVENGQLRFGIDLTADNIPLEAGLKDRAIDFNKGCYIGQEVICRIDAMGTPARQLVRLRITGDSAPAPGTSLFRQDKLVGHITSSVLSSRLGGPVALGYLKKKHNEPGVVVRVGETTGAPQATVEAHA